MADTPTHEALRQCRDALRGLMDAESRGRVMPIGAAWDAARAALAAADAALSLPAPSVAEAQGMGGAAMQVLHDLGYTYEAGAWYAPAPSVGAEGLPERVRECIAAILPHVRKKFPAEQALDELAALASRPAVDAWQPIETAPKDCNILLGTQPSADYPAGFVGEGYWLTAEDDCPDSMGHDAGFVDLHFSFYRCGRTFCLAKYQDKGLQPTHWMPLPAAPDAARHPAQREGE